MATLHSVFTRSTAAGILMGYAYFNYARCSVVQSRTVLFLRACVSIMCVVSSSSVVMGWLRCRSHLHPSGRQSCAFGEVAHPCVDLYT